MTGRPGGPAEGATHAALTLPGGELRNLAETEPMFRLKQEVGQ
jgi:hypothetical protein